MTEYNTYFHRVYFSFTYLLFNIFKSGFTPRTAEQPLRDRVTRKKNNKKIKAYGKSVKKEPAVKKCLLILDLNPFRSYVKAKHSIGRKSQSLTVRRKKLLT